MSDEATFGFPEPSSDSFVDKFLENLAIIQALAVISCILGTLSILLNLCVIVFHVPKYKEVFPLLYLVNCTCDCVVGFAAILIGAALVKLHKEAGVISGQEPLLATIFFTESVFVRMSVFCSLVMSVVRVINITFIRYKVNYKLLLGFLLAVLLFWLVFVAGELYLILTKEQFGPSNCGGNPENNRTSIRRKHGHTLLKGSKKDPPSDMRNIHLLEDMLVQPFVGKDLMCQLANLIGRTIHGSTEVFLLTLIPFIIPVCLAFCLLILTVAKLFRTSVGRNSAVNRSITITVTWLTFFYVLTNLPLFIIFCVLGHPSINKSNNTEVVARFVASVILPALGSVLIPATLIARGSQIKQFYKRKIVISSHDNGGEVGGTETANM